MSGVETMTIEDPSTLADVLSHASSHDDYSSIAAEEEEEEEVETKEDPAVLLSKLKE